MFAIVATSTPVAAQEQVPDESQLDQLKEWQSLPLPVSPAMPTPGDLDSVQAAETDSPDGARDWIRLVFQADVDGNWDIVLAPTISESMDNVVRLTDHPAPDTRPRLSHDARHIVFVSERDYNAEIYLMEIESRQLFRLTDHEEADYMPSWSPDGQRIVFVSERTGNPEIFTMRADGSDLVQLTDNDLPDLYPNWSPTGSHIAWVQRDGEDGRSGRIWTMETDGEFPFVWTNFTPYPRNPVWTLDGQQIAYDHNADSDWPNEITLFNIDGSGSEVIYDTGDDSYTYGLTDAYMDSWVPDSDSFLFTTVTYDFWEGSVYVKETQIRERSPSDDRYFQGLILNFGVFSDAKDRDNVPPVSTMEPLPPYSRGRAYLQWHVRDYGPACYFRSELQVRDGPTGEWEDADIYPDFSATSEEYISYSTGRQYFRVRALDNASNEESFTSDPDGDTSTIVYHWEASSLITDNRGVPRVSESLDISPQPLNDPLSDYDGIFKALLPQLEDGSIDSDIRHDIYQLPQRQILVENFEADHAAWTLEQATVSSEDVYAGVSSMLLLPAHRQCDTLCLGDSIQIDMPTDFHYLWYVVVDDNGLVHFLTDRQSNGQSGVADIIQRRTEAGWDASIEDISTRQGFVTGVSLDQEQNLHIVWRDQQEQFLYSRRAADSGTWSQSEAVGEATNAQIVADEVGNIHVFMTCWDYNDCPHEEGYYHRLRDSNGTWSDMTLIRQFTSETEPAYLIYSAATSGENVHLVWQIEMDERSIYMDSVWVDGTWQTSKIPMTEYGTRPTSNEIYVGNDETIHMFGRDGSWHRASSKLSPGFDYTKLYVPYQTPTTKLLPAGDKGVYRIVTSSYELAIQYLADDGRWNDIDVYHYHLMNQPIPSLAVDSTGVFQALFRDTGGYELDTNWYIQSTLTARETSTSAISTTVTIPADIHQPTVSFMHHIQHANPHAGFSVHVNDGITTTTVFTSTTETPWQLGWADLSPWAGETITLTFESRQTVGYPFVHVYLDEISVGEWRTPVPQSVEPNEIDAGASTTIEIHGENFLPGPDVWFGDRRAASVRFVDETLLEVTPPSNLPPGMHAISVRNAGDAETTLYPGLRVGKPIFLPQIVR